MNAALLTTVLFAMAFPQGDSPPPASTTQPAPPAVAPPKVLTEAERIIRIRETIDRSEKVLEKLKAKIADPESDYAKAQREFEQLGSALREEQDIRKKLIDSGRTEEAAEREKTLKSLQENWETARDQFNIAILQRKATIESMNAMQKRMEQEKRELERLEGKTGKGPAVTQDPAPPNGLPGVAPPNGLPQVPPGVSPPAVVATPPNGKSKDSPTDAPKAPANPGVAIPGLPVIPPASTVAPVGEASPEDPAVKKAREQVEARRAALKQAEENLQSTEGRIQSLAEAIQAAEGVVQAERAAADLASQILERLTKRLQDDSPEDLRERQDIVNRVAEANKRLTDSRERIRRLTDRIGSLNGEMHSLEQERLAALKLANERKREVEAAGEELVEITNPFTFRNLARWFSTHGPNLLVILAVTLALYTIVRIFSRQIVRVATHTSLRGTDEDRENRARTLVGVFRYSASLLIIGGGTVMLLDEAGIPIVPLMGGAAVIGLAVAFGAQNLIKDYFSGFMILMEDQYGVNDVVKIGDTAGLVEQISLRVTVLRDMEGVRHFIPHGSVGQVSNLTHTWSRAVLNISVAYEEDVDRVMNVLLGLARELRSDAALGRHIIEDAEMLGVDSFDESGITIKMLMKTKPLKQWLVKREMLRRIKNRFDELNISIPYPHRTVYHKFAEGTSDIIRNPDSFDVRKSG